MRSLIRFLIVVMSLAMPASLFAQNAPVPVSKPEKLETLFSDLKRARDEQVAKRIADKIWAAWFESGSATVDFLIAHANTAIGKRDFDLALDLLDQAIMLAPDNPESWNRRATVHFMLDNHAKSMTDIERTLRLEPRHFGALAGMAAILRQRGNDELASRAYERALAVYPMMRSAQTAVGELTDKLAGEGI